MAWLHSQIVEASVKAKVMAYDDILREVQDIIENGDTSDRDKLTALKLLGSAKTIAAWKEVHEVKVNAHESFILNRQATPKLPTGGSGGKA